MTNRTKMTFCEFLRLGNELRYTKSCLLTKLYYYMLGIPQINSRIRGGHIINEIQKFHYEDEIFVLDAGFGNAITAVFLARKFKNWTIYGYEFDERLVHNAQEVNKKLKIKNLFFEQQNLLEMDDHNKFDIIYSCDVLEHIVKDNDVLKNFREAIKDDGYLVLHLPLRYEQCKRLIPWFVHYKTADHVRDEYTPEEIEGKLERASFKVLSIDFSYRLFRGELAFEINNLLFFNRALLMLSQLVSMPFSLPLGFCEISSLYKTGNSLLIKAIPINGSR